MYEPRLRGLTSAIVIVHEEIKVLKCDDDFKRLSVSILFSNFVFYNGFFHDSHLLGNYGLSKVLPQIYDVKHEPLDDHAMALVSLLIHCEESRQARPSSTVQDDGQEESKGAQLSPNCDRPSANFGLQK
jgi:hypothetical protein